MVLDKVRPLSAQDGADSNTSHSCPQLSMSRLLFKHPKPRNIFKICDVNSRDPFSTETSEWSCRGFGAHLLANLVNRACESSYSRRKVLLGTDSAAEGCFSFGDSKAASAAEPLLLFLVSCRQQYPRGTSCTLLNLQKQTNYTNSVICQPHTKTKNNNNPALTSWPPWENSSSVGGSGGNLGPGAKGGTEDH